MKIVIFAFLAICSQNLVLCADLSASSQNGTALGLLTMRDILKNVHIFNKELINQVLESLSRDPNSPLSAIMPDAKRIILATHDRIDQCYDSSVGDAGDLLDIFNQPLGEIVLKFVNAYRNSLVDQTFAEFKQRINTLLSNIIFLAGQVIKCALNTNPNYKSTRLGLTPFAIYTHEEFLAQFSGNSLLAQNNDTELDDELDEENVDSNENRLGIGRLPTHLGLRSHRCEKNVDASLLNNLTSFDWRLKGVVTEVRNQYGCQSCYIFSAVGTMESAYMIHVDNSSLVRFSEQQFVDCLPRGCDGGTMPRVWVAAKIHGLALADKYPHKYKAQPLECKLKEAEPVFAKPISFCQITDLDKDEQLMAMIYQHGPTAIALDASSPSLPYLKNGPWNGECSTDVNHALIAVGWDEQFWIIKNSWGPQWGIQGYLYLPKKQTNICGIYDQAGVPFFR